jgi:hypothetical protein
MSKDRDDLLQVIAYMEELEASSHQQLRGLRRLVLDYQRILDHAGIATDLPRLRPRGDEMGVKA